MEIKLISEKNQWNDWLKMTLKFSPFTQSWEWGDILIAEELPTLIEKAGFSVERFSSVHDMYVEDNLCMLQEVHHNWDSLHKQNGRESTLLLKLLEWERFLFQERYWTGVVLYARKR